MTEAQRQTLARLGLDPGRLPWRLGADDVRLPSGRWLWADGTVDDWPQDGRQADSRLDRPAAS